MMSVIINFHWENPKFLCEEHASLSQGWIEVNTSSNSLYFFEKKHCMIFITVSELIDFLISPLKKITWVGADSGEYYLLEKRSSILYVSGDSMNTKINLFDFQIELIRVSSELTNNIRNSYIRKEGAFIDLLNSLENAKTVI